MTDEQIIDMWNRAMGSVFTLESRALAFARALLLASGLIDYSQCCDSPAFCSSVRRCTAKDSLETSKYNPSTQPGSPYFDGAEAYEAYLEATSQDDAPINVREIMALWITSNRSVVEFYRAAVAAHKDSK